MINKKCIGCGAFFQTEDPNKEGYVEEGNLSNVSICKRCFRIKNYGDYKIINKPYEDYEKIFNEIKDKKELILYLCDIFNLDETLNNINKLKGKVILVITKSDLLPKSVKERKLKSYIEKNYDLNIIDLIFVSSLKNYNLDLLMNLIKKHKISKNIYLVGNTNSGKSTLINRLIKSYSSLDANITTSVLPATTLDIIKVKLNEEIMLMDTPGLVNNDNYLTGLDSKNVKKISPKTEIKPRTFQMKPKQSIIIGDYARIDYLSDIKNSFTIYISNEVVVKRISLNTNDYLRNLNKTSLSLKDHMDVVINGLCFCKIVDKANIDIYVKDKVSVKKRPNLI